jgi:hypothetical protein
MSATILAPGTHPDGLLADTMRALKMRPQRLDALDTGGVTEAYFVSIWESVRCVEMVRDWVPMKLLRPSSTRATPGWQARHGRNTTPAWYAKNS